MSFNSIIKRLIRLPGTLFSHAFHSRRSTMITIVTFFGLIIAFNLFKAFMIKQFFAHYQAPPITISAVKAISLKWSPQLPAVGNFIAINGVDVNAEAAGNVVNIHFTSGEYIEKGEPLIDINDSVDQATLKYNLSELTLKEINFKRQVDLFKKGATSSSSLDEAKANLQQAQANVEKTQAQIQQKHIIAPFSGRVGIRNVNLGQFISPGQTTIVSLQSIDPLYLNFNLPEQYFKQLSIGQPLHFSVQQFPQYYFTGKITAINSKIDVNTHNILVEATIANCPAHFNEDEKLKTLIKIRKISRSDKPLVECDSTLNTNNHIENYTFIPGMFASMEIAQPKESEVIVVPSTAISYSLYGNSVFVLSKSKEGQKDSKGHDIYTVNRVFVKTGEQANNDTVIEKGLKAGQQIVSAGEIKLQNGARVVINNEVHLKDYKNPDELGQ